MTDRFSSLTVVLEGQVREDDAQGIIDAIRHIKGVISVDGNVDDSTMWTAKMQVKHELSEKLWKVLNDNN